MIHNPPYTTMAYQIGRYDAMKLNAIMEHMTAEERLHILEEVALGYCSACGTKTDKICHCQNDE